MLGDVVKMLLIMSLSILCMQIHFQHSPRIAATLEGVRASFRGQSENLGLCLLTRVQSTKKAVNFRKNILTAILLKRTYHWGNGPKVLKRPKLLSLVLSQTGCPGCARCGSTLCTRFLHLLQCPPVGKRIWQLCFLVQPRAQINFHNSPQPMWIY